MFRDCATPATVARKSSRDVSWEPGDDLVAGEEKGISVSLVVIAL